MIITISRQFASGGREVGKRLADALNLEYYDKEIVAEIAKSTSLTEDYVDEVISRGGYRNYALSFAHTLPLAPVMLDSVTDVLVAQQKIIKAIGAKKNCVIVGRSADVILKNLNPVRIFVYADEQSKIKRCGERERDGEDLNDKKLLKKFKEIDKGRKKLHELFAGPDWGEKESYDIMLNTSDTEIKDIIPSLAELVKNYKK